MWRGRSLDPGSPGREWAADGETQRRPPLQAGMKHEGCPSTNWLCDLRQVFSFWSLDRPSCKMGMTGPASRGRCRDALRRGRTVSL